MPAPMHDLGVEYPKDETASVPSPAMEGKHYPCVYGLSEDQLPDLDLYDAGDEVMLHVKAVVKSKRITEDKDTPRKTEIELELREASVEDVGDAKVRRETGMSKEHLAMAKQKGMA